MNLDMKDDVCTVIYNLRNAKEISKIPLSQDSWNGTLSLIFAPINAPDFIEIILKMREHIIIANKFTFPSATPNPAARLSKDNAIASDKASLGESVFDSSKSASFGSAYIFNMKLRLRRLNLICLSIMACL